MQLTMVITLTINNIIHVVDYGNNSNDQQYQQRLLQEMFSLEHNITGTRHKNQLNGINTGKKPHCRIRKSQKTAKRIPLTHIYMLPLIFWHSFIGPHSIISCVISHVKSHTYKLYIHFVSNIKNGVRYLIQCASGKKNSMELNLKTKNNTPSEQFHNQIEISQKQSQTDAPIHGC